MGHVHKQVQGFAVAGAEAAELSGRFLGMMTVVVMPSLFLFAELGLSTVYCSV